MNAQVNWQRIRNEFQRLTDVEQLKSEVTRIGNEIRKFDYHAVLSPAAQAKVKVFEKRYGDLMRSIHQAQRQVDREFGKILRKMKTHRNDVTKAVAKEKKASGTATGTKKKTAKRTIRKRARKA